MVYISAGTVPFLSPVVHISAGTALLLLPMVHINVDGTGLFFSSVLGHELASAAAVDLVLDNALSCYHVLCLVVGDIAAV